MTEPNLNNKKPTRRLPRGLKKKLEASLTSLTPKEAGRLALLYLHDMDKKTNHFMEAFGNPSAPMKELNEVWDKRLEDANKNGPEAYNEQVDLYNGFRFLERLAYEANTWINSEIFRLMYMATHVSKTVYRLLLLDGFSETTRFIRQDLVDEVPDPISREDYKLLRQWVEEDALIDIHAIIESPLMEDWEHEYHKARGLTFLIVPDDFKKANVEQLGIGIRDFWKADFPPHSVEMRKLWVNEQGDRLLTETFKGSQDLLDDWVEEGGYPEILNSEWEAIYEAELTKTYNRLVAKIESGEVTGYQALLLQKCYDQIALKDGTIPAWAAFRQIWSDWVFDQAGHRVNEVEVRESSRTGYHPVSNLDGEVTGDDLTELAGQFLDDCRRRSWGNGIASEVDLDQLADFLVEAQDPLMGYFAPDLGWVDWTKFKKAEKLKDRKYEGNFEADWVVPAGEIKAKALTLGLPEGYVHDAHDHVLERYYPTDKPKEKRKSLIRMMRMLSVFKVRNPPFIYRDKASIREFYGMDFFTPLEDAVAKLGHAFAMVATFRKGIDILSDEFFGGMPIVVNSEADKIDEVEMQLEEVASTLNDWADRLADYPWEIKGIDAIRPLNPPAWPDQVAIILGNITGEAALGKMGSSVQITEGQPFDQREWFKTRAREIEAQLQAEFEDYEAGLGNEGLQEGADHDQG